MDALLVRPPLADLYRFIAKVDAYPVSADELVELAREVKAPRSTIEFYKSFGRLGRFADRADLINRSEQVEFMRQAEKDMPDDSPSVPQED